MTRNRKVVSIRQELMLGKVCSGGDCALRVWSREGESWEERFGVRRFLNVQVTLRAQHTVLASEDSGPL